MSVFSARTGLSSILKAYKPTEREKAKAAIINKVRFEMPKLKGMQEAVLAVKEHNNYQLLNEYMEFLKESALEEGEFLRTFLDARKIVHLLSPKFTPFVEVLLAVPWLERSAEAVQLYSDFYVDLLVANNKHLQIGIDRLITLMTPTDNDAEHWLDNKPSAKVANELQAIHGILRRIMNAVPMSFDVILDVIEKKFPYFKRPPHVIVGYMHNLLWMTEYKPIFTEYVVQLLLKKLIILDVNAPRNEIEETEEEEEDEDDEPEKVEGADFDDVDEMNDNEEIFQMDDVVKETLPMNHPIAHTLDMCMQKMFNYLDTLNPMKNNLNDEQKLLKQTEAAKFLKILLEAFDCTILPCHNTHHVQFVIFYFCSFKSSYAEAFLRSLWDKTKNPNISAIIRQTCVGYMASFLARCKTVPLGTLKHYLMEFSNWAHQYIERIDQCRSNNSLKANLVFYSICQAIFYVIAFRSRDLTTDKKGLLFLQSLHLSALVTCNFNPLRVTLPAVATAFAGVTRAYQLAYCHAILERNARRKLATIYANDMETPEETLDTFFPFDPYILKSSIDCISPTYLQYKPNEVEENHQNQENLKNIRMAARRKRGDSEMLDDHDIDDFLLADKRQKFLELAKSQEREAQFTYGLSPGFHQ